MELRVLRYFLAATQTKNISRAADVLHITQPTLSRQLAQLEEELGTLLFIRGAKQIVLTESGRLFQRRAAEIITLADKTIGEMNSEGRKITGTISLGIAETMATQSISETIRRFHRRSPAVRFDLISGNSAQVQNKLDKGLIDIGLFIEPIDLSQYDFFRLPQKDQWVVMMQPGDPLAGKESVSAVDLADKPVILPSRVSDYGPLSGLFCERFSRLQVVATYNLISNAARLVLADVGRAITIDGALTMYDTRKFSIRPLSPAVYSTSVLMWQKSQPSSPAFHQFLSLLKDHTIS